MNYFSAGIHAGPFLKDGHEYVYDTMIVNAAGTMDVSTHTTGEAYKMTTRVQKSGQTLNVEVSKIYTAVVLLIISVAAKYQFSLY